MNVRELREALKDYDPYTEVEIRAYCCTATHPIKVEVMYAEPPEVRPPTIALVVISDVGIRWSDIPGEPDDV